MTSLWSPPHIRQPLLADVVWWGEKEKTKSTASSKTPNTWHPTRFGTGQQHSDHYKLARFATNLSYVGNSPISGAT